MNTNNHHQYAPFKFDGERGLLLVHTKWWDGLHETLRTDMLAKINVAVSVEDFEIPHQMPIHLETYRWYGDLFSFEQWAHLLDHEYDLINVPYQDVLAMLKLSTLFCLSEDSRHLNEEQLEDFSDDFLCKIRSALSKSCYANGAFVKTSQTSGKNESEPIPSFRENEVISRVINSTKVVRYMHRDPRSVKIVLQPWNDRITEQNEFRVVVTDSRLVAISQQHCYGYHGADKLDLKSVARETVRLWNRMKPSTVYKDVVLDVYVDQEGAHLIECNPGGLWASSGSSLFEWLADYRILHPANEQDSSLTVSIRVLDSQRNVLQRQYTLNGHC